MRMIILIFRKKTRVVRAEWKQDNKIKKGRSALTEGIRALLPYVFHETLMASSKLTNLIGAYRGPKGNVEPVSGVDSSDRERQIDQFDLGKVS